MLLIDGDDWPLALVRWEAPVGVMDIGLYRVRFEDWLRRGRPFAVLSIQPPDPGVPALQQMIHAPAWTAGLRRRAAQRCAALACVVPDAAAPELLSDAGMRQLPQLTACPVRAFLAGDEALRWARARLREFRELAAPASASPLPSSRPTSPARPH